MKDTLDEESRQALIKYRMERAYDSMNEAKLLADESFYNAAINRLYYACYYAAVALLLANDIPAQTHSGVKTMLGLHFITKGTVVIMMLLYIVTRKCLMNFTQRPKHSLKR